MGKNGIQIITGFETKSQLNDVFKVLCADAGNRWRHEIRTDADSLMKSATLRKGKIENICIVLEEERWFEFRKFVPTGLLRTLHGAECKFVTASDFLAERNRMREYITPNTVEMLKVACEKLERLDDGDGWAIADDMRKWLDAIVERTIDAK